MVRDEIMVRSLIEECVEFKHPLADAFGLTLKAEVEDDRASLRGDRRLLRAAISNLIDSAMKRAKRGGCVIVGHSAVRERDSITVSCNGDGFSYEELREMQDLFCRSRMMDVGESAEFDRRLLGLSIARDVADLHSGRIGVRNSEGRGAVLSIHLPRYCLQAV
jgi:two-component system, OmpR family, sensor histidine kinase VicK